MTYRLATPDDAAALARLRWEFSIEENGERVVEDEAAFLKRCGGFLAERLASESWICWIALDGPTIVAHAYVETIAKIPRPWPRRERFGYVTNVYTRPALRGRGLGAALLSRVHEWADAHDLEFLILWPSARSGAFYRRAGYRPESEALVIPFPDAPAPEASAGTGEVEPDRP